MITHALLSPSGAERWLNCPPSARLEQEFPDKAGSYAEEGSLAHSLGELLIRKQIGEITDPVFKAAMHDIQQNELYSDTMHGYAGDYSTFVLERYAEAQVHTKDALLFVEQRLNLTDYIPEGFGTGDAVIIADSILDLIDLKYGQGVSVSAENNKQMMLYGLGALKEHDFVYDIHTVRLTIYQPRIENFSTWEISVEDLKRWAEQELIPKAAKAFNGLGEFFAGKHCRFCKARAICRTYSEYNLRLAQYDFRPSPTLTDDEIADIMNRADEFGKWLNAVEEYALDEAVNHNKKWPGYKLVEGKSNRKFTSEEAVAKKLIDNHFTDEDIYKKKLLGIGALESLVGKKKLPELIGELIFKPPGKPALVLESDKRPPMNSVENARKDFSIIE